MVSTSNGTPRLSYCLSVIESTHISILEYRVSVRFIVSGIRVFVKRLDGTSGSISTDIS
jgi:hypothetical protein